MIDVTTARRRPGPAPRFSREQLVDAALTVVEGSGFGALSLRSVARELGVGPMTLYTYVEGVEDLVALVVDRLVDDAVRDVRWPRGWRQVLRVFARRLDALLEAHPSMVEAYAQGLVRSGRAEEVATTVLERLVADGLGPEQARDAYVTVHAVVLGLAVTRAGRAAAPPLPGDVWTALPALTSGAVIDTVIDGL